jgi:hypothetical protein
VDDDSFWAVVEASRAGLDLSDPEAAGEHRVGALKERLTTFPDQELLLFQARLHEQTVRANDWRIWAAGYVAAGGMSDDAFEYFRLWLILQGRTAFERVLADPDSLVELDWDDDGVAFDGGEAVAYLVREILEDRGIDPLDALVEAVTADPPIGERFSEDDEAWFAEHYPRLWARSATKVDPSGGRSDWDRITDADVAAFLERSRREKERRPVEPLSPLLAATLYERGYLPDRDRPMLAAYWLAEGREGEALLELASLSGHEREVGDLWPLTLAELGVGPPTGPTRNAMAWGAGHVLAGNRSVRWLVKLLWPTDDGLGDDPELAQLIYTVDDWLDWTDRDLRSRREDERRRAESARKALHDAVEAMARDDLTTAGRLLEEWREQ